MSLDKTQFRDLIRRSLHSVDSALCSDAAINLLLGTAAQESKFVTYLRQLGTGPALGVFQIEPATFNWLRDKYSNRMGYTTVLQGRVAVELEWDIFLSIVIARLRYRVVPAALPPADDIEKLAAYWKLYYNTPAGAGTVEEFIKNYERYVT